MIRATLVAFGLLFFTAQQAALAECPAGVWQETQASVRRITEQSATGGASHITYVSGGRLLTLNADHTGSFTYQNIVSETHTTPAFWMRQTKTGGTHFTWRVVNGTLMTVLRPGDNLLTLSNELHSGSGVTNETRRAGAQSIGHVVTCESAGLHLRQRAAPASPIPGMSRISVDMDFVPAHPTPGH